MSSSSQPFSGSSLPSPTTVSSISSSNASSSIGGVVDMPLPGQKGAPKKFKGKHSDVLPFLYFYEHLCQKHHVISDNDKTESITQCCSRSVRKFMEGLPSYQSKKWLDFVKDIKKFYDAEKDTKRFKLRDLEKFAKRSHLKSISNMAAWIKYSHDFIRIAGWLKSKKNISDFDYKYYFWIGISESLRSKIEGRLICQKPNHDLANPFEVEDVSRVAESLLQ